MNKEQEAIASCNGCDRELLVNGSKSLLGSMHSNVGSDLTSLIFPGLTWKKFSKGIRTSSRRPRDLISNGFKSVDELINKVPGIPEMTISESEKHGVSVLGCRFSGKAGYVPMKKRKFMFRSPSPPPRGPSLSRNKAEMRLKSQLKAIDCTASNSDIGQIVDAEKGIQDKNLVMEGKCLDENEDFSGISLLAAMACSTSFGGDFDHVEQVSGVEGSLVHEDPSMDNNSYSFVKSLPSEHLSSAEVSTEGTGSSLSVVPAEELVASPRMDNSSTKFTSQESKEHNELVQDHYVVVLEDVLAKKDEVLCRDRGIPSRANRLHWDLNTPMETWERPFDYLRSDSHVDVAEGTAEGTKYDNCMGKMKSFQDDAVDEEPGCGDQMPCKEQFSQDMEFRLQTCVNADSAICSPEKLASSSGYINPISALTASASTDMDKSSVSQCLNLGSTGNSESLASHHVAGVDNVVTPKSSHSSSNCVSGAAACDATGIICIQNKAGCASSAGEICSSGAQVENEKSTDVTSSDNTAGEEHQRVTEAADMRDSSHVPAGCQPLKSEQDNDVRESSLCQSDGVSLSPSSVLSFDSKVKNELIPHRHEIGDVAHEEIGQPMTSLPDTSMELSDSPPGFSSCKPCRDSSEGFVNSSGKDALEEPFENGNDSDVSHDEASVKGARFVVDYDSQYEDGEVRESIEHTWEEYDGEDMESEHSDYALYYINLGPEGGQIMKNSQSADLQPCRSSLRGKDASTATNTGDIRNDFKSRPDKGIKDTRTRNSSRTNRYVDDMGGFDAEDRTRMVEPRAFRRAFVEGRTCNDGSWRKERVRYAQHGYSRGRGGDHWVDYRDNNRGFTRYRSPHDRDDTFGLPMPMRPSRDWSPDRHVTHGRSRGRGRGRSMQYGIRADERSPRGRYHGPVPNDCVEFRLKHPLAKRDTSFSPIERRRDARIYRSNSKSSSRSRSPNSGNPCFRQQGHFSKSPNFRSEMRNQRGRSPHGSPPPPRNTRWISDRKDNAAHPRELGYNQHSSFLDRRASGRFGPRNDRFAMVDSPRTLRPMHTGRFTETEGVDRDGSSWFVTTD